MIGAPCKRLSGGTMKLSTDRIVSLSAMLVGVGSLFIILYQTQLLRESQRASVLPYMMVSLMANDEGTYIVVRNSGVGPALIEDVRIRHRGRELAMDPYDFYVSARGAERGEGLSVDKLMPGRLISAGEWVLALGWEGEGADAMVGELLGLFDIGEVPKSWYDAAGVPASGPDKAIIDVTYASVYGERWRVTSDQVVPVLLD
jgi:hypothetical protein